MFNNIALKFIKNEYIKNILNKGTIIFMIVAVIYAYILSNQSIIVGNDSPSFWSFLYGSYGNYGLFMIFLIVNSVKVISSEYENGTMSQLAIKPISRRNLILFKYAYVLSLAFMLILIHFTIYSLLGFIKYGDTILRPQGTLFISDHTAVVNYATLSLMNGMSIFIDSCIFSTLAFMTAILLRKPIVPTVVTLMIWIFGAILNATNLVVVKKVLFTSNIHLISFITGSGTSSGNSFIVSLLILVANLLVFYMVAMYNFCKCDIKNSFN